MYLKKLSILGFKTFADKTTLEFAPGITCIVGPNGGGKSNIADSVRFCLGEQSTKSLRAQRLEEVIFAGSAVRKLLGMGEVEMLFDNSDKTLPIEFAEIDIKRRIFREGENQFFINKSQTRLKDIQELFMGTGIGSGGLAFLSQNEADLVLSSSENRRMIIEEVAGTNKYKFRKKEAARKLAHTDLNLSRLHDILNEVNNQLKSLESQVRKFRRYNKYKVMLTELEREFLLAKIKKLDEDYQPINDEIEKVKKQEDDLACKLRQLEEVKDSQNKLLWENEEKLNNMEETITQTRLQKQKQNDFKELIEERITNYIDGQNQLLKEIENIKHLEDTGNLKIGEYKSLIEQCIKEQEKIEAGLKEEIECEKKMKQERGLPNAVLSERYQNIISEVSHLKGQVSSITEKLKYAGQEIYRLSGRFEELKLKLDGCARTATKNAASKTRIEDALDANKKILAGLENVYLNEWEKICYLNSQETEINKEIGALSARGELLKKLEHDVNYRRGASKKILESKETIPGILGLLTHAINFPEKLAFAVESLLRFHMEDVIVETESSAIDCINYLKDTKGGFVTCWPCDGTDYQLDFKAQVSFDEGITGWASDLIQVELKYEKIFKSLLHNVLVVNDINTAKKLRSFFKSKGAPVTIVTLSGDIFMPNGAIRGGAQGEQPLIVSWDKEYDKISRSLEDAKARLQTAAKEKADLEDNRLRTDRIIKEKERICTDLTSKLNGLEAKEKFLINQLNAMEIEQSQISDQLSDLKTEEVLLKDTLGKFEQDLITKEQEHILVETSFRDQKDVSSQIDGDLERVRSRIEELLVRQAQMKQKETDLNEKIEIFTKQNSEAGQRLSDIDEQTEVLKEKAEQSMQTKINIEKELETISENMEKLLQEKEILSGETASVEKQYKETLSSINSTKEEKDNYHDQYYKLEMKKVEYETKYSDYKSQLLNYNINFEEVDWESVRIPDFTALDKQINRLKNFVNNFGGVNLAAEEDYKQFKERQEFLSQQIQDLENAKESLLKAIKEYDENCIVKFKETFAAVAEKFKEIFTEVFRGGTASLVLTNEEDILESGVDIKAQPPGKRLQNISLLSGGEKSLTSVAFLFALLEVRRTPFIIMDELDAPLDDSNIVRVADLIKRYSKESQFIIITHNRKTMEVADMLYGVTMEEQGVSKILAVRLEEAQEEYSYSEGKETASVN
ncbi:MAG: chromosome segregation protein SMC [Armatimonadota bacterium]